MNVAAALHAQERTSVAPASGCNQPVRILVVDDSSVVRSVFERIILRNNRLVFAGSCASVDEALQFLARQKVEIILLDIEMPGRNGLEGLPEIIARSQGAAVFIISSHIEEQAPKAIEALTLGAHDILAKPGGTGNRLRFTDALLAKIDAVICKTREVPATAQPQPEISAPEMPPTPVSGGELQCIAIGSSTGGIIAIQQFLKALPPAIDCPILITQHLPLDFMSYFARQLDHHIARTVLVGRDDMPMERGHVYIASGLGHLGCAYVNGVPRLKALHGMTESRYLPAVDPMLQSVAQCFGAHALGVIMSGMGHDGLIGAGELRAQGAAVIVQDEQSSVVWGMPGAIANAGLASAVLPPAAMGSHLAKKGLAA